METTETMDIMGMDIMGMDIMGMDIMGMDMDIIIKDPPIKVSTSIRIGDNKMHGLQ